jgi:hypothetical protein
MSSPIRGCPTRPGCWPRCPRSTTAPSGSRPSPASRRPGSDTAPDAPSPRAARSPPSRARQTRPCSRWHPATWPPVISPGSPWTRPRRRPATRPPRRAPRRSRTRRCSPYVTLRKTSGSAGPAGVPTPPCTRSAASAWTSSRAGAWAWSGSRAAASPPSLGCSCGWSSRARAASSWTTPNWSDWMTARSGRSGVTCRWCSRIPTPRSTRGCRWGRSSVSRSACTRSRAGRAGSASYWRPWVSTRAPPSASRPSSPAGSASASASPGPWRWSRGS